jgi:hypothetical protein
VRGCELDLVVRGCELSLSLSLSDSAVTALLTLVLEVLAIVWASIVRGQTQAGGIFAPDRNAL